VPKASSKPSLVTPRGPARPALLMRTWSGPPAADQASAAAARTDGEVAQVERDEGRRIVAAGRGPARRGWPGSWRGTGPASVRLRAAGGQGAGGLGADAGVGAGDDDVAIGEVASGGHARRGWTRVTRCAQPRPSRHEILAVARWSRPRRGAPRLFRYAPLPSLRLRLRAAPDRRRLRRRSAALLRAGRHQPQGQVGRHRRRRGQRREGHHHRERRTPTASSSPTRARSSAARIRRRSRSRS
jgi:hypothetical protein